MAGNWTVYCHDNQAIQPTLNLVQSVTCQLSVIIIIIIIIIKAICNTQDPLKKAANVFSSEGAYFSSRSDEILNL